MNLKSLIKLAISSQLCKLETQKSYEHTHQVGSDTFKGNMTFDTSKEVNGNGKLVTIFSGKWKLGTILMETRSHLRQEQRVQLGIILMET
jgi:hypothetical protein